MPAVVGQLYQFTFPLQCGEGSSFSVSFDTSSVFLTVDTGWCEGFFIVCFCFCCFILRQGLCVDLGVLELPLTSLASTCIYVLNAGIKGKHHHA